MRAYCYEIRRLHHKKSNTAALHCALVFYAIRRSYEATQNSALCNFILPQLIIRPTILGAIDYARDPETMKLPIFVKFGSVRNSPTNGDI